MICFLVLRAIDIGWYGCVKRPIVTIRRQLCVRIECDTAQTSDLIGAKRGDFAHRWRQHTTNWRNVRTQRFKDCLQFLLQVLDCYLDSTV